MKKHSTKKIMHAHLLKVVKYKNSLQIYIHTLLAIVYMPRRKRHKSFSLKAFISEANQSNHAGDQALH